MENNQLNNKKYTYLSAEIGSIQEYIFKVPKLKIMLGANSLIGELFNKKIPEQLDCYLNVDLTTLSIERETNSICNLVTDFFEGQSDNKIEGLKSNLRKGILSKHGGHFIAIIDTNVKQDVINTLKKTIAENTPDLLFSIKTFDFSLNASYKEISKLLKNRDSSLGQSLHPFFLQPHFTLPLLDRCQFSGSEAAIKKDKDNLTIGKITNSKKDQGEKYYKNKAEDFLTEFHGEFLKHLKNSYSEMFKFSEIHFPGELEHFYDLQTSLEKQLTLYQKNTGVEEDHNSQENINSKTPDEQKKKYLALIFVDGNDMGKNFKEFRNQLERLEQLSFIEGCVYEELYWYTIRNLTSDVLKEALAKYFFCNNKIEKYPGIDKHILFPFRILMLGGDEFLLITKPRDAFYFLKKFACIFDKKIKEITKSFQQKESTLTYLKENQGFGSGIVIFPHKFPINQAHALVEDLLSSSKRLKPQNEEDKTTSANGKPSSQQDKQPQYNYFVDWHTITASFTENISYIRNTNYQYKIGKKHFNLTARPYRIMLQECDNSSGEDENFKPNENNKNKKAEPTLVQQIDYIEDVFKPTSKSFAEDEASLTQVARSKLKSMRKILLEGEFVSKWTAYDLFQPYEDTKLWDKIIKESIWEKDINNPQNLKTQLLDLIELSDILKAEDEDGNNQNGSSTEQGASSE